MTKTSTLLSQACNHTHEKTILHGVCNQDWPTWYADYVIQHDLGELLNQTVTSSEFFRQSAEDNKREHPAQNWADYPKLKR
jgi:hypothetical protein